jgi:ATP-binding cassette, subfamily B, bacterial
MLQRFKKFPHYRQHDQMDCGPACLKIISKYYGKEFSQEYLRERCNTDRMGTSMLALSEGAEKLGYKTDGLRLGFDDLVTLDQLPVIAHWQQKHFVVVHKIKNNTVYVADPAHDLLTYSKQEFLKNWCGNTEQGIVLTLQPMQAFYENKHAFTSAGTFAVLKKYLRPHRIKMIWMLISLLLVCSLQIAFPFLTQKLVDDGIVKKDIPFVYMILLSQLFVFLGRTSIEVFRSFTLLHLSNRINIQMLSDFFAKLMRLPLGFFDLKMIGDILQRINDHYRIEQFLTSGTINVIFSFLNLLVFSCILLWFSPLLFVVFAAGSIVYFLWIKLFMKRRADLDYKRFNQLSQSQEKNLEIIIGMQEIKLNNAEQYKRSQWQQLQQGIYSINLKNLHLSQWQTGGASVINELKNIFITFLTALLVMNNHISLGIMLSVSYIIGQLNGPVMQLIDFMQQLQDAKLSLKRVNEIHQKPDEEAAENQTITHIPPGDLHLQNVSFKYDKSHAAPAVLRNINLVIPTGKVTAIVGSSGSGKTTLLKLLLQFYKPDDGNILVGNSLLRNINAAAWRNHCGAVLQEGYIFNDTIARNIAFGKETIDEDRLLQAASIANADGFIQELPMKYETAVGQNGLGLSTGQKQRILIARAVYKNPRLLFFDEATSALDSRNERRITENLQNYLAGKTVVIIAHRLSTVKHADHIVVLENGSVAEYGTHDELVANKGFYFNLVKNQLELGI